VALDWGLIVPVIKPADELSLHRASRGDQRPGRACPHQEAAAERQSTRHVYDHQSGGFGVRRDSDHQTSRRLRSWASARSRSVPRLVTAADGTESIAIRRTMGMLTMSYDHRVVDGADADGFRAVGCGTPWTLLDRADAQDRKPAAG